MKKTYASDICAAVHQTAEGLYRAGLMDKKTMREFDELCLTPVEKLTPAQIKAIREEANISQTVFARHLNVTPLAVSQWERGERSPGGAALKLLTLVKHKGLDCIA